MSLPQKDSSGRIIKKTSPQGLSLQNLATGYSTSGGSSLFNLKNFQASVGNINGAYLSSEKIGYLDVTPGTAAPSKALVLDLNKNIAGVNRIKCDAIVSNGVSIDPDFISSSSTPANDFFSDNIPGTAVPNKSIIPDSSLNISGVKNVDANVISGEAVNHTRDMSYAFNFSGLSNLSNSQWRDVVYSIDLKKFIAVGHLKTASSINGTSWVENTQTVSFRKVIWVPHVGKFFAVAANGLHSSIDGNSWFLELNQTDVTGVAAGNNIIIASGTVTRWSSYNSTWTNVAQALNDIVFDGTKFIGVGNNVLRIITDIASPVFTTPATTQSGTWESVAYGNGQFMATNSAAAVSSKFIVSKDGNNWSPVVTMATSESELTAGWTVKFLNGYFYCLPIIPRGQETQVYYTKDSTEWFRFRHNHDNHLAGIAWDSVNDKLLLLSRGTSILGSPARHLELRQCYVQYSKNTQELTGFTVMVSIPETQMLFACGLNTLYYSTDGWTFKQCFFSYNSGNLLNQVSRRFYTVVYSPTLQLYIAGSDVSTGVFSGIAKSTDGINWTDVTFATQVRSMVWSSTHSKFIGTGLNTVIHSSDGNSWSTISSSNARFTFFISDTSVGIIDDVGIRQVDLSMQLQTIGSSTNISRITRVGSTYYAFILNSVSSSTNLTSWTTILADAGSAPASLIVYHKALDALVIFKSNSEVGVYKDAQWSYSSTSGTIISRNGADIMPCYDENRQCVFTPSNTNSYNIARTVSTRGTSSITSKYKLYRTLPSGARMDYELNDAIITSFTKPVFGVTTTGASEVERVFYSRGLATMYGFKTAPSLSNLPVYTSNGFKTSTALTNPLGSSYYIDAINMSPNNTIWISTNGSASRLDEITRTGSSNTNITTSFVSHASIISNKLKKIYNNSALYTIDNNSESTLQVFCIFNNTVGSFTQKVTKTSWSTGNPGNVTYVDYVYNNTGDELVIISGNKASKYIVSSTLILISEATLPTATYYQIEYIGVYVATSSVGIVWSNDAITWNLVSGISGPFNKWSMGYVPELNLLGIVTTGLFAFTKNGSQWTVVTTSINKAWTSFDYNSQKGCFVLHCKTDGTVLTTSPVQSTLANVTIPSAGYVQGSTLTLASSNANNILDNLPKHAMEIISRDMGKALHFNGSSRTVTLAYGLDYMAMTFPDVKFLNTIADASPFRINGFAANINSRAFSSLNSLEYPGVVKNSLVPLISNNIRINSLQCSSLTEGSLPLDNIAGPVIADNSKNISIKKLTTDKIVIGNSQITSATQAALSNNYMHFKRTKFSIGIFSTTLVDSAYSPELDTIVLWGASNDTLIAEAFYTSKDKGVTWNRSANSSSTTFTLAPSNQSIRRMIWCQANMSFIAVGDNIVWFSPNGYEWTSVAVPFGTAPHIFYDSKTNRLVITSSSKIAWTPSISNLSTWTLSTYASTVLMMEYFPSIDRYVYVMSASPNSINQIADIYQSTLTGTALSNASSAVLSMVINGSALYYHISTTIYKKTDTAVSLGTSLNVTTLNIRRLRIIPEINTLIAFANNSILYSTNETQWTTLPNSHMQVINPNSGREGFANNAWFTGDRVMITMADNGEILESDIFSEKISASPSYISDLIDNKMSTDVLINARKENGMLYMKHSSVSRNLYATSYGNNTFVTVGSGGNLYTQRLLGNHTWVDHAGEWRDIIYNSTFIKVGTNFVSTSADGITWNDISVPGNWTQIVKWDTNYVIASNSAVMYSSNLTNWTDISTAGFVNGIKIANQMLFALSNDNIYYKSEVSQSWSTQILKGTWFDIEYARNLYVMAGAGMIARGRSMTSLRRVFAPKTYHKVIYVRLYSDFFLMSKETFYDSMPSNNLAGQTNAVIRTNDGISWTNSLKIGQSDSIQALNLSNIHYFEDSDQFFLPLNNSGSKIYIASTHTVANKDFTKITTPSCFSTRNKFGALPSVDIARNSDLTTASPALFNVFQDSAAKPSTSTWTTTSDSRVKTDIVDADIELCYKNIKSLSLKHFKWKDEFVSSVKVDDRNKLGWIAQDVEAVIPKAVTKVDMFGYSDCRVLDQDQLIAMLYGTVQSLIKKINEKQEAVSEQ